MTGYSGLPGLSRAPARGKSGTFRGSQGQPENFTSAFRYFLYFRYFRDFRDFRDFQYFQYFRDFRDFRDFPDPFRDRSREAESGNPERGRPGGRRACLRRPWRQGSGAPAAWLKPHRAPLPGGPAPKKARDALPAPRDARPFPLRRPVAARIRPDRPDFLTKPPRRPTVIADVPPAGRDPAAGDRSPEGPEA
jgi:hypothetical protein